MKIAIDKIKIATRIRKEIRDIEELAKSIRERGLITPIAVMPIEGDEYQLLAGLRRIRALEMNGETEIEVNIISVADAEESLRIEFAENDQREDFTYSEKMDYSRIIEEIEAAKAKERMLLGKSDPVPNRAQGRPRTRVIVGEKIGMTGQDYQRAKYIADHAPQEVIDELDRGEVSVRKAYDALRSAVKPPKSESVTLRDSEPETKPTSPTVMAKTEPQAPAPIAVTAKETPRDAPPSTASPQVQPKTRTAPKVDPINLLSEQEREAIRKNAEFEALPPQEKIAELQRQLRAERARAATAESDLARERELRQNDVYHRDGTIELLKTQLESAYARIKELEENAHATTD